MPDRYRCTQCGELVPADAVVSAQGGLSLVRAHLGGLGPHYYCGPVLPGNG